MLCLFIDDWLLFYSKEKPVLVYSSTIHRLNHELLYSLQSLLYPGSSRSRTIHKSVMQMRPYDFPDISEYLR